MTVITRFAPSPTGFLHIGGARTALFCWLFAKHHGGQFKLRIEDTDRERSTQEAMDAILESMDWLDLPHDGDVVYQSKNADRHVEVAHELLAKGHAYKCYCTPEELKARREQAEKNGQRRGYDGRCRERAEEDLPFVVRFKASQDGETRLNDLVQGEVNVQNAQLDDMVMLRADGTPTYMLSVVVDDHDMGVTHVIRGDDHLTNAFRQYHIYTAMGWDYPAYAHIPLIHGPDGAKLSKRHGALGTHEYKDQGLLPEAMCNYLLRLGWGHGDDEIISREQAIEWFDTDGIGKSPARFDIVKMTNLNGHYIAHKGDAELVELIQPWLDAPLDEAQRDLLTRAMPGLKSRAKTLIELAQNAAFYIAPLPLHIDEKANKLLTEDAINHIKHFHNKLSLHDDWTEAGLESVAREYAEQNDLKLGKLAQPLRAAITGRSVSPSIFEVMLHLGKDATIARLKSTLGR